MILKSRSGVVVVVVVVIVVVVVMKSLLKIVQIERSNDESHEIHSRIKKIFLKK